MYNQNKVGFQLVTAPSKQAVTTEEIKNYLKIDNDAEDVLLETFINAATKAVENYTGKALITQTRKMQFDWIPDNEYSKYSLNTFPVDGQGASNRVPFFPYNNFVELAYNPIQSVTSIIFTDTDNSATTFSAASYYLDSLTGRVILKDGSTWDSNIRTRASMAITYVCGFGDTADKVPADIRMAMWQMIADMYNCRSICGMSCECQGMLAAYKDYNEYTV